MEFKDLLERARIDSGAVLMLRHRPKEPKLRTVLPWLVDENHDLFNAYQQTQGPRVEKAMESARFLAAFIGHEPGRALFVGLYEVGKPTRMSYRQFWAKSAHRELRTKYGMVGMADKHASCLRFELTKTDFRADWKGKLTIQWPGKELSWWRWADRPNFEVLSIVEESIFARKLLPWDQLTLSWAELDVIPRSWRDELSRWRGIYYILDTRDGKGYVGSACGADNIYGRWLGYAKTGHGGNKELRNRDPRGFLFSILQILPHDMAKSGVDHIESTWKDRLHTREFGLNRN